MATICTRKLGMAVALTGAIALTSAAVDDTSGRGNVDSLLRVYSRIANKAGISFGGEFRGEFMNSGIDGLRSRSLRPTQDNVAANTVDLDLRARPHAAAQGRLIFRLHTDWRDVWNSSKPAYYTRWISIDGSVKDLARYSAGHFREKITPLTLHSPELDMLYEPSLFSLDRVMAMEEEFLDNHERIFQGVRLVFESKVSTASGMTILDEMHVKTIGSRLRHPGIPNDEFRGISAYLGTGFEKYLAGGDGEVRFLKGLSIGGTYLALFDRENGSRTVKDSADLALRLAAARLDMTHGSRPLDAVITLAELQRTDIISLRGEVRLDSLFGAQSWRAGVRIEGASAVSTPKPHPALKVDSSIVAAIAGTSGKAMDVEIQGGLGRTRVAIDGAIGYLSNDPGYFNELAQSPNFVGTRIMNIENDSSWGQGTDSMYSRFMTPQYTTFDALYRHVFRFAPRSGSYANLTAQDPYTKNSHTHAIMTQRELQALGSAGLLDPSVQLLLPLGPATPNRQGIDGSLCARLFDNRIELQSLFASLQELEAAPGRDKTRFMRYGAGGKVDIGKIVGWKYPLTLYAGMVASNADGAHGRITSTFTNAGADIGFWRRTSLLGGFQMIENALTGTTEHTEIQTNMGVGLKYRVTDTSYLLVKVSRIVSDDPTTEARDLVQDLAYVGMRVPF